jgi:RHS repeat-associated protein
LRFPGQYYDAETGLNQNMARDYDPSVGRYIESDPIGIDAGVNTYAYVKNTPVSYFDSLGLDAQMCARPFYPLPSVISRHCFLRFNGNNNDTISFDNKGVHRDPAPGWWPKSCTATEGKQDDDCLKREMKKCKAEQYDVVGFNCCHCAEQAMKACGLSVPVKTWPNWPINPGPQPGEKADAKP